MAITSNLPPSPGGAQPPRPDKPVPAGEQRKSSAPHRWSTRRVGFAPRPGQSMVELALVFPPVLMLLLIAANAGLAVHTHTKLAQAAQQAAQIFLHHPEPTADCNDDITTYASLDALHSAGLTCYADDVAWYLHNHGFSDISKPHDAYNDITVTPTADCEPVYLDCASDTDGTDPNVLTLSLNVEYGFPLVAPVLDNLSFGPLKNGRFNLGAVASTIGAVPAPSIQSVTRQPVLDSDGNPVFNDGSQEYQYLITWNAPTVAASGVTLTYCIYTLNNSTGAADGPLHLPCDTGTSATVQDPPTSQAKNPPVFQVSALEANGLESPLSDEFTYTSGS